MKVHSRGIALLEQQPEKNIYHSYFTKEYREQVCHAIAGNLMR